MPVLTHTTGDQTLYLSMTEDELSARLENPFNACTRTVQDKKMAEAVEDGRLLVPFMSQEAGGRVLIPEIVLFLCGINGQVSGTDKKKLSSVALADILEQMAENKIAAGLMPKERVKPSRLRLPA